MFNSRSFSFLGSAVLLIAGAECSYALDPGLSLSQYSKRNWQVEEGLSHNYVMTILPEPSGYLLVGTDEGLVRFDGVRFLPFDLERTLRLSKRWVTAMIAGRDHSIWVGTFDGGLYQWRDGKVLTRFEHGASIFSILEDASGRIWASTRNGVIKASWKGRFESVSGLERPPDTAWNVLSEDARGSVWIVTAAGLYRSRADVTALVVSNDSTIGEVLTVQTGSAGEIEVGTSKGLFRLEEPGGRALLSAHLGAPGPVVSILWDRDHNLWAGTWGKGLYQITGQRVRRWSSRDGLPDDFVRTLYEDTEGNFWIGLRGGGLSRWKDPTLIPLGIPEGLKGDFASTVATGTRGDLWLGTWRGGLYRFENGNLAIQPAPVPILYFTIRALTIDPRGNVWVGNWEGLFRFDGHKYEHFAGAESPFHHISVLLFDRQGRLWIGTSDNGLYLFSSGQPDGEPEVSLLPGNEINSLHEDVEGNIWVGTAYGVGWISPTGPVTFTPIRGLIEDAVAGISEDTRHRLWACTLGGALWQLRKYGTTVIDARHGLPPHPLYYALDDGAGSMWISSSKGILQIPMSQIDSAIAGAGTLAPAVYNVNDGMRTIECHRLSQPAGGKDRDGNLWFPTTKGFVRVRLPRGHTLAPPPVHIEETMSDGNPLAAAHDVSLPAGSRNVEIHFTGFWFSSPEKIRFRYRLEGLDPAWIPDNGTRTARYNRIPPGTQRFLVSASLPGGTWSEPPAMLALRQMPLFYQTRWFLLLIALAAIAVIIGLFRWRIHIIKMRYAVVTTERNRIAREWHDTLVAGFSAISLQLDAALLRLGERQDRVRELLEVTRKMVHHYRAEARRVIWDLRDTRPDSESFVDAVSSTLRRATEGKEIHGTMSVVGEPVSAPKDVELNLVRICQEALSNAVRHGQPEHLRLEVQYQTDLLKLRIEDDGGGFEPARMNGLNTGHFGLTVMQERARRFGGDFTLNSRPGRGTVIEATIPLRGSGAK